MEPVPPTNMSHIPKKHGSQCILAVDCDITLEQSERGKKKVWFLRTLNLAVFFFKSGGQQYPATFVINRSCKAKEGEEKEKDQSHGTPVSMVIWRD